MMGKWAQFWAVDLHVHTPASSDAKDGDFGTPSEVVQIAINAGLSAIAVTDHNTVAWCGAMAEASKETDLVVLPGFELSTRDGHLLGIWEEGTDPSFLEDVLVGLGIERKRFGDLDIVAPKGMADCAREIGEKGGIAIAAHIDKERGILNQPVKTHANELLANRSIVAYEYVLDATPNTVAAKLHGARELALVQSSDAYDASLSRHAATGIGVRRTWIKAARPDLCGVRYALEDPELRVTLSDPSKGPLHPTIDSISIPSGFLSGLALDFSPDLNCLLGGTGAGKSLVLEALRFALDQQVDAGLFETINDEVDRRLNAALGEGTEVVVQVSTPADSYRITRTYSVTDPETLVEQDVAGDWVQVDREPSDLVTIAAFSQGEILEYARQPVGRVGLVDARLDLAEVDQRTAEVEANLRQNGAALIAARTEVERLEQEATDAGSLKQRVTELSTLFDSDLVTEQGRWAAENSAVSALAVAVDAVAFARPKVPEPAKPKMSPEHDALFSRIRTQQSSFQATLDDAEKSIESGLKDLKRVLGEVKTQLHGDFLAFKKDLDEALEVSGSASTKALRKELERVQGKLSKAEAAAEQLNSVATPEFDRLGVEREEYLAELRIARGERRRLRRERVKELNKKTSGFVKLDIPDRGATTEFRRTLEILKVGSRIRERVLDLIAEHIPPDKFADAIWSGELSSAGPLPQGVVPSDFSRLIANAAEHDLWQQVLDAQIVDTPDVLSVKFKKPEGKDYAHIEDLSHGQKCTAILVILLADGESPVLIDQPEDALHAPWIEEYLVDRLRELRGTRQYMFATRSPGLVVSADAEQLITMTATSGRGEVEASGSLERHDLNKLALHHLEGGRAPFARRRKKLDASLAGSD